MRTTCFLALMVAFSVGGSPALADPPIGSRIDPAPGAVGTFEKEDEATAVRVMKTFTSCVARQRRRGAQRLLDLAYRSSEQNTEAARLVGGEEDCMGISGGELRFQAPLLAGGLAEHFIQDRYREVDLTSVTGLSDEQQAEIGAQPRNAYEDLAQCIVRRDAGAVMDLISARPSDDEEKAIFARIVPHLPPCVPAGMTITFGHSALRALLSVGLYRILTSMHAHDVDERE